MKWRACTAVVVLLFATALHIAAGPAQPDSDGQTATRAFEPDENMVQAEKMCIRDRYWSDYYTLSTYLPDVRIVSSVLGDMRSSLQHILAQDALDPYKIITIEQAACIASVLPLLLLFLIVQKTFARSVETTGLVG